MCNSSSDVTGLVSALLLASEARIFPLVLMAETKGVMGSQKSPGKCWDLRFPTTQTGESASASNVGFIGQNKILMSP